MNMLDEIAKKYGTDKSSETHDYCWKYEKYLPFRREDKLKILEIGVLGGQSLKMWEEYFYNSQILGIDILPECKQYENSKISIEIGSQTDEKFLKDICETYGTFDMILDDGSHMCSDVIFTFKHLLKSIKSGGVYIIEDSSTSYYPDYGGGNRKQGTSIEYFKEIVDEVNFFGEFCEILDPKTGTLMTYPDTNIVISCMDRKDSKLVEQFKRKGHDKIHIGTFIESINFLNSIIIITKR